MTRGSDFDSLPSIFETGPNECSRCGSPHVVPGHSRGITGAAYPAWVCDEQNCGVAVCWRREREPCGTDGCENECALAVVVLNA